MKQTLALKLGQSLTMTPQLQQAIRLLQLSALDLQEEIQSTLEENPMLELTDEAQDDSTERDQSLEQTGNRHAVVSVIPDNGSSVLPGSGYQRKAKPR